MPNRTRFDNRGSVAQGLVANGGDDEPGLAIAGNCHRLPL